MAKESTGLENLDKELETLYQPKAGAQPKIVPKKAAVSGKAKKSKVAKKVVIAKAKRKKAVARASLTQGNGSISINGVDVNLVKPSEIRDLILEPVNVTSFAKQIADVSNIYVKTNGGGFSGQAQAARNAIAKVLVKASQSPDALRGFYMDYDRNMIIDDTRRVEPKKFRGPKARARFQTSYR
ncbi:MAG: 30S ribosomal protein S9 [Candidatus Marsarchaeota archaeon]|nr:30S ribosomal protein S9 [Candidatus Marsarchaeota archaeon]MCL5413471.1 30S ribosomal protein S9 [Candidatus Marsarchaeota archaeon]